MDRWVVGQRVTALMRPTAVIVGTHEPTGEPLVEAWGYGRFLGPVKPEFLSEDPTPDPDGHWFKVAIDTQVRRYGESARPVSEVARELYHRAAEFEELRAKLEPTDEQWAAAWLKWGPAAPQKLAEELETRRLELREEKLRHDAEHEG